MYITVKGIKEFFKENFGDVTNIEQKGATDDNNKEEERWNQMQAKL